MPTVLRRSALLLVILLPVCSGCGGINWRLGLEQQMKTAARDGRLVLVYHHEAFNDQCERMERTVFRSPEIVRQTKDMIPVRLDAKFNRKQAARVGLRRVPSFAVLSPSGEILRRGDGPMDVDQFLAFLVVARLSQ